LCGGNNQCLSGFCVDGVCCNGACTGQCQACNLAGSAGTCSPAPANTQPVGGRAPCSTDGSVCGGSCDGTHTAICNYPSSTTSCRSASCTGGSETAAAGCNGAGACPNPSPTPCAPFVCGSTACLTKCTGDSDCSSGNFCNLSTQLCQAKLGPAVPCNGANQCASGFCVDGFCCDQACGGQCQACDVSGNIGKCSPVVSGAPHGSRPACTTDGTVCGGACAAGNTALCTYGSGATCRAASCTNGTATLPATCNASGACPAVQTQSCAPFVCGATACLSSCTNDGQCATGDYCNQSSSQCQAKKGLGNPCIGANECQSNFCVDGVCCSSACAGQCQACNVLGSVGTCSPTPMGQQPVAPRAACAGAGTACGGSCNGSNATSCTFPSGNQCRAASCASGTASSASSCDGAGGCPGSTTISCSPFVCGASTCLTMCASDNDCVAGDYCQAGTCVTKLLPPAGCNGNNQCASGFCVDGVCCNAACTGQCQACDVAGKLGTCSQVPSGAPHGARMPCATDGTACGGSCSLNPTACTFPSGNSCRAASCVSGTATQAATCNATGTCPAAQSTACAPYSCNAAGTACLGSCGSISDCTSGDYCNTTTMQCSPKKALGVPCGNAVECQSDNCVDGVCCSSACSGQCQACNLSGSAGTCTPVALGGQPVGIRPPCTGAGTTCGGACNGTNTMSCSYPSTTTACRPASCVNGVAVPASTCDGNGSCSMANSSNCSPYVCGASACLTMCASKADCMGGNYCQSSVCMPQLPNGAACSTTDQCLSGFCTDGVCCNSACNGQCQACNVSTFVGTCSPVTGVPHAPRMPCSSDGSMCGGSCDGMNLTSCAYPTSSCRAPSCAGGVATLAASCDGAGSCPSVVTKSCAPLTCNAAGSACANSCASDTDCASGNYCDSNGQCLKQGGIAAACTASNQCLSSFCADGVCCGSKCDGQCQACNQSGNVGSCIAVTGAPVGNRAACTGKGTTCGGTCNGTNTSTCTYPPSSMSCGTASCNGTTFTPAAACDGAGTCVTPPTQSCIPYVCGATACTTSCASQSDCVGFCNTTTNTCSATFTDGSPCGLDSACASGHCVDGVCCNSTCTGQCQRCDQAGSIGTCTTISGAPVGNRMKCMSDGSACGGVCDGTNPTACTYPGSSTSCSTAQCAGYMQTPAAQCNGTGTCPVSQPQSCQPFNCNTTTNTCMTACNGDGDCMPGYYCDAHMCVTTNNNGKPCSGNDQCMSGFCVDNVCCNTACNGNCESCVVPGSVGTCSAVKGIPLAPRPACKGTGACAGTCDGTMRAFCTYPTNTTVCALGSCAAGVATAPSTCDGNGGCAAGATMNCANGCEGPMCAAPPGSDGGTTPPGSTDDGGPMGGSDMGPPPSNPSCHCEVGGTRASGLSSIAIALLLLGALLRRRFRGAR
jgi:hypothetical protein